MTPFVLLTVLAALFAIATPAALKPLSPSNVSHDTSSSTVPADPFANYTFVPLTWKARPFPGAELITVKGTIEDVTRKMLHLNPQYLDSVNDSLASVLQGRTISSLDGLGKLGSLGKASIRDRECFNLPLCSQTHTYMGAIYLARLDGQPHAGPGPGECSRVSCEWNSGITWCNDNEFEVNLKSWMMIADGAWFIADHCTQGPHLNLKTSGQIFYTTGWNVMVHGGMRC